MARALLLLTTFAGLAAWAGAQGTAPLSPADRVKFFKTNRTLIENLVTRGEELSRAGRPLERAEACKNTANALANALRLAGDDPDRVAELADLMSVVVRDGLVPNLDDADREIPPDSRELRERLGKARGDALADIDAVGAAIPEAAGGSEKVKAALAGLAALKSQIKK